MLRFASLCVLDNAIEWNSAWSSIPCWLQQRSRTVKHVHVLRYSTCRRFKACPLRHFGHRECAASRMDALGRSFLAAAKSNDVAAMERYRSRQGDIHVATTDGCSALMMAALYRSEEAVEWCLQVSGPASAVCDRVRVRARVQCCAGAFVLVQSSYYNRHGWPSVPACARVWRARVHRRLCDIAAAGAVVSAAGSCMPVLPDVSV